MPRRVEPDSGAQRHPGRHGLAASVLDAIGATPLVELSRVVAPTSGRVLAKLEYLNPGGSKKDRIALRMVEEAEATGALRPGQTVVELTSGNSAGRDGALLDPSRDPAKVRAMYTHPSFTRRGVGRLVLDAAERAARSEGFTTLELMATLAGMPLYEAAGFVAVESVEDPAGGTPVPLVRMRRAITGATPPDP